MLIEFRNRRARMFTAVAALLLLAVIVVWVIVAVRTHAKWTDAVSALIALAALCVAVAALRQSWKSAEASRRSAGIAEAQETRRRYGWNVTLHPNGQHYEIRNTGTLTAESVELGGDFAFVRFLVGGNDEQADIAPGEARAFRALAGFSNVGVELTIEWLPEGESERRRWRETLPPLPDSTTERIKERRDDRVREDQQRREDARDQRELILRLGDAYADWKADLNDPKKKLRVQLLASALPPWLAREVGYQVDVARNVWGPGEYPFSQFVTAEDWEVIEPVQAEIELMWNMRQLVGYPVHGPTDAEGPNTEPRIWWAIQGYLDRVREREAGERKLRNSRADQEHEDQARRMIQQFTKRNQPPVGGPEG
jgi:hypothetical protein